MFEDQDPKPFKLKYAHEFDANEGTRGCLTMTLIAATMAGLLWVLSGCFLFAQ